MTTIILKGVRFKDEVQIPGEPEKRGLGAFAKKESPEHHELSFDSDTQLVRIRHKSGLHSDVYSPVANVRDMFGLQPAPLAPVVVDEPITQVEPVGTVSPAPEPKRVLVVEKGAHGKGVGRVIVGDPEED